VSHDLFYLVLEMFAAAVFGASYFAVSAWLKHKP
jgi:hypothetical protein